MTKTRCALCYSQSFRILYPVNFSPTKITNNIFWARRLPDRLHYRIVRCTKCNLVRSSPILELPKIAQLYQKSDVTYQSEIPYLKKTYGSYLKKIKPRLITQENLLDIGCGNGFFLEEAKDFGFKNVWGVEPAQAAVKKAPKNLQKFIINDFFKAKLFPKDFFDVVTCFQTLDHVTSPNLFITDTRKVLKPGGYALFITHNIDSFLAKLLKTKCPIIDIEHIYLFSKKTLNKIFIKNQFKVIRIFDIQNTYSLDYWFKMSPLPKQLKLFLTKNLPILSRISLTLPVGNIGILVKK